MITLIPTATPDALTHPPRVRSVPLDETDLPAVAEETLAAQAASELSGYEAYLQQAGQHERLTLAQELALAATVQAGRAADGTLDRAALAARDHLVAHNLKLALFFANKYGKTSDEREDLTSAANHGLMIAAERFRPDKNACFNTYASWPIYSMIMAELGRRRRVVDLPRNIRETLRKVARVEAELLQQNLRVATDEELGAAIDLPAEKVALLRELGQTNVSLDAPVDDDSGHMLGETLRDDAVGTARLAAQRLDAELIRSHLRDLGERACLIVELRTGLHDGREWTLDEIGARLKVSRERIRQLSDRTCRKVKEILTAPAEGAN